MPSDFNYNTWGATKATSTKWVGTDPIKPNTKCAWIDFSNLTASSRSEFINKLEGQGFDSSCNRCTRMYYGIKFTANANNNEVTASGIPYNYHSTPANIPMPVPSGIVSEVLKIDLNDLWDRYTAPGETRSLGEVICATLVDVIDDAGGPADTFNDVGQKHPNSCLSQHFTGYTYKKGTGKLYLALIPFSSSAGLSTFNVVPRDDNGKLETSINKVPTTVIKPAIKSYTKLSKRKISIHAGSDSNMENKIPIDLPIMSIQSLKLDQVSALTEELATNSIDILSDTLHSVSNDRSRMGAYQNRLEHTALNLDNIVENTTHSESKIRDTNIADEMMKYSNKNILTQAGQSMLSQANTSRQNVLSLLSAS